MKTRPVAFCLVGLSPAVVTETLYALALVRRPRVIPGRVIIVTTQEAYPAVVSSLLGKQGAIRRLISEYDLPPKSFQCGPDDVILFRSRSGRPLDDIRSDEDSRAAGESLAGVLAEVRRDPAVQLHCSLAGGRKTTGALLALALQMCARPGDRLYHVLVNEPFERIPDFFFPPRRCRSYTFQGRQVYSRDARIDLAEIPVIRLGMVAESLGLGSEDLFRRAKRLELAMTRSCKPVPLVLAIGEHRVRVGHAKIRLPPQEFILYRLYAELRRDCSVCGPARSPGCPLCHPTDAEIYDLHRPRLQRDYEICNGSGEKLRAWLSDRSGKAEARISFDEWLRQARSRLNRRLRRALPGETPVVPLLVSQPLLTATQTEKRRGISLPPRAIKILNVDAAGAQR